MTADPYQPSTELLLVARSLRLDWAAGVAALRLREAGIPSILLKGPSIASWLYHEGEVRPYLDVDLLISPSQLDVTKATLAEIGYVHPLACADPVEVGPKEQELFGPDDVCIDLHHGLIGVSVSGEAAWDILCQRTVAFRLGPGAEVQILDIPARAMHLALHAAQDGPIDRKALADLERGVALVGLDVWRQAAGLARELGAEEPFAAGLRLLPAGREVAGRLSLTRRTNVELALRTRSAPQQAIFFERLVEVRGIRPKAALVARKIFPTSAYLQAHATTSGRAQLRLLRAWMSHLVGVARWLPAALVAWLRVRLDTRSR